MILKKEEEFVHASSSLDVIRCMTCGGGGEDVASCRSFRHNYSEYLDYRIMDIIRFDLKRIQEQLDIVSCRTLPPRDTVVALSEQLEQFESNAQSTNFFTRDQIDDMYVDTLRRELPPRLVVSHILPCLEFKIIGSLGRAAFWRHGMSPDGQQFILSPLDMWGYFSRDITRHRFFLTKSLNACYLEIEMEEFARFLPYIFPVANLVISGYALELGRAHIYQRCYNLERLRLQSNTITMDNIAEAGTWLNTGTIRTLDVHLYFDDAVVLEAMKHLTKCCTDCLILRMEGYGISLIYCLTFRGSQLTCMEIITDLHTNLARHRGMYPDGHIAFRPPFGQVFALLGVPHTVKYKGWFPSHDERHVCERFRVAIVEEEVM